VHGKDKAHSKPCYPAVAIVADDSKKNRLAASSKVVTGSKK
jgi:hypothetical protein